MNDATIRAAGVEDAATVATLFSEFNALLGADGLPGEAAFAAENVNVSASQMARRLASMEGVESTLLAETPEGPAGLCCLRLVSYIGQDAPYAEVTQLYVRAAYKRRGIGALLLRAAEAMARAEGATCMHIITGSDNPDAQVFYRAQGYISETVVFDKYFAVGAQHAAPLRQDEGAHA